MFRTGINILVLTVCFISWTSFEGECSTLPRMSLILDGTSVKPQSVILSLQWVGNDSLSKTVYFKKIHVKSVREPIPYSPGNLHYLTTLEFPDPEYLSLQSGTGKFRVVLSVKVHTGQSSGIFECVLEESDWTQALSTPDTFFETKGSAILNEEKKQLPVKLVYHPLEAQLYILVDTSFKS